MNMNRTIAGALGLALAATAGLTVAAPAASAGTTVTRSGNFFRIYGDLAWPVPGVLFVNQTREAFCTPEEVAWEDAFAAWLSGSGEDPGPAPAADGLARAPIQDVTLKSGVVMVRAAGHDLPAELWSFDEDVQGPDDIIAPCIDSDGAGAERVATGTGSVKWNDNAYRDDANTRGNAWRYSVEAQLTDTDGNTWEFVDHFSGTETKKNLIRLQQDYALTQVG